MTNDEQLDVRIRQLVAEMTETSPGAGLLAEPESEATPTLGFGVVSGRRWAAVAVAAAAGLVVLGVWSLGRDWLPSEVVTVSASSTDVGVTTTTVPGVSAGSESAGGVVMRLDDGERAALQGGWMERRVRSELLDLDVLGSTAAERQAAVDSGGLSVRLAIEPDYQRVSRIVLAASVPAELDAGLVMVDHRNGHVVAAMATDGADLGRLLPAPPVRLATYAAAIEDGYRLSSEIDGTAPCAVDIGGVAYETENFGGSQGSVSPLDQLIRASSRCALLRLQAEVGVARVRGLIEEMSGTEIGPGGPPVIDPPAFAAVDMAAMYATVAERGIGREAGVVLEVYDRAGNTIWVRPQTARTVMSPDVASELERALIANVHQGTGTRAAVSWTAAGGLTGTTQEFTSAWFVGSAGDYTAAIWVAYPSGEPMRNAAGLAGVTGGRVPGAVWGEFMEGIVLGPAAITDALASAEIVPTSVGAAQENDESRVDESGALVSVIAEIDEAPDVLACDGLPAGQARHLGIGDGRVFDDSLDALAGAIEAAIRLDDRLPRGGFVEGELPDGSIVYYYPSGGQALMAVHLVPGAGGWKIDRWEATAC